MSLIAYHALLVYTVIQLECPKQLVNVLLVTSALKVLQVPKNLLTSVPLAICVPKVLQKH